MELQVEHRKPCFTPFDLTICFQNREEVENFLQDLETIIETGFSKKYSAEVDSIYHLLKEYV